jgi:ribosome-associated toxin RatA of RatAB toxin-antitoxin module
MAIQLDYVKNDPNFSGSMTAFNAYWKIEKIQGTKLNINFDISISLNDKLIGSKSYSFAPSMNSDNFIKQAYEYLKTLPEFADAMDV